VLTVGTILFIRSLVNLTNVDTGFNREGVLRLEVDSNVTGLKSDNPRMIAMFQQIEERVGALPGVKAASFASFRLRSRQLEHRHSRPRYGSEGEH
jgi:hypothetical protein